MAHEHSIDKLTALWLLPVVAPILTSATGANLCGVIPEDSPALESTLVASYVLWGVGMPFAMSILVLYIHRLTVYKVQSLYLLTTAPCNRSDCKHIPPHRSTWSRRRRNNPTGNRSKEDQLRLPRILHCSSRRRRTHRINHVGIRHSLARICRCHHRLAVSQNEILNGMVGIYFPPWYGVANESNLGTFSLLSAQLGKELGKPFFSVMATIVTVCVILLWTLVASMTTIEGWRGKIFYAPCLATVGDKIPEPVGMIAAEPRAETDPAPAEEKGLA
jgi:hypothetical protein